VIGRGGIEGLGQSFLTNQYVEQEDGREEEVKDHHDVDGPVISFEFVTHRVPDTTLGY
jgi:hypothetical protein